VSIIKIANAQEGVNIQETFHSPIESVGQLVSIITNNAFYVAIFLMFLFIVFGAFTFIVNAGSGSSESAEKGAQTVKWAIVGFAVVLGVYFIVQMIETFTGINYFTSGTGE
jgi:cytochrome bd-type quinol oxidase subunit 2